MGFETQKPSNLKPGEQIDLDFTQKLEMTFEQERTAMAALLGLMDETKLQKKEGKWYVGNLTADEYLSTMSGNDIQDIYKH